MSQEILEARRQVEICNACRYCEGFCSVFPAITKQKMFSSGDITQLANLCHNCRGCYYACQYAPPHEFALNLPKALAEVRQKNWQDFAYPQVFGKLFYEKGFAIAILAILSFSLFFLTISLLPKQDGQGFYQYLSHGMMVTVFIPSFLLPLVSIGISLRRFWAEIGGSTIRLLHLKKAFQQAATMKNLDGGQGQGCNFENEDDFSLARKWAHHLIVYGFFLCFLSTSSATIMHYIFGLEAPYPLFSLPKVFGLSGGIMLCIGTMWLTFLKLQSDRALQAPNSFGGEMGFISLLFMVSFTGLTLYFMRSSLFLFALHLGCVMAFFLLMPYSKMVHGFYRLAALVKNAQN